MAGGGAAGKGASRRAPERGTPAVKVFSSPPAGTQRARRPAESGARARGGGIDDSAGGHGHLGEGQRRGRWSADVMDGLGGAGGREGGARVQGRLGGWAGLAGPAALAFALASPAAISHPAEKAGAGRGGAETALYKVRKPARGGGSGGADLVPPRPRGRGGARERGLQPIKGPPRRGCPNARRALPGPPACAAVCARPASRGA